MKKYLLPALFMCLYAGASAAETPKRSTDANLFGHVVDRETHEHIPYASVAVVGTAFGTTTDASGHYFLKNLPVGELTLEVRALGYASGRMTVALERGETRDSTSRWRRAAFRWTKWSSRPAARPRCGAKRLRW